MLTIPYHTIPYQADMIHTEDLDELIVPPDGHPKVSTDTAIDYQCQYRDMVAEHMMKQTSGYMVGGPGTMIEIDAQTWKKSKISPEHHVECKMPQKVCILKMRHFATKHGLVVNLPKMVQYFPKLLK